MRTAIIIMMCVMVAGCSASSYNFPPERAIDSISAERAYRDSLLALYKTRSSESYDFRRVRWGMTRSEIIEHEGRYGLSIDSYFTLVYDLSPSSITRIMHGSFLENGPALLTYWLANNSLVSASYNYDTTEASADSFYVSLVEEMTTLYGEPAKYDDTQSDWLSCTWDLDRTKIVVVWDYRGETTKVSAKYYSLLFAGEENDPVNLYYAR